MWRNLSYSAVIYLLAVAELQAQTHWSDWFYRLPLAEPARVRHWVETLRRHPDAAQRLEAVRRLAQSDPRAHPDVIPALVDALRRDPAASVRQLAADTLGRFPVMSSQAGVALEEAMERDPVDAVRAAARQALWEYHLLGYHSPKGVGGFVGQTAEPPLASPAVRQVGAAAWPAPATRPSGPAVPVPTASPIAGTMAGESRRRWFSFLPSLLPTGPVLTGPTAACLPQGTPPRPSELAGLAVQTAEPPLAVPRGPRVADVEWHEPPVAVPLREPVRVVQLPPIAAALPPLVPPPGMVPAASSELPLVLPPGTSPTITPPPLPSGGQGP